MNARTRTMAGSGARVKAAPARRSAHQRSARPVLPLRAVPEPESSPMPGEVTAAQQAAAASGPAEIPAAPALAPGQGAYVDGGEEAFTVAKISFGTILLYSGSGLLSLGFGTYFHFIPGDSISALALIYGFPATLLGFAFKYAELLPVGCRSTPEALALRDVQATDIQTQIRKDVTRFRYGDEQHLDEALERIFTFGRGGGVPRRMSPLLVGVREEVFEGGLYGLVLEFEHKERFELEQWEKRIGKVATFFGPGITASMEPVAEGRGAHGGADIALVCDGSGAGRGGGDKGEILPPLMPGLKARQT